MARCQRARFDPWWGAPWIQHLNGTLIGICVLLAALLPRWSDVTLRGGILETVFLWVVHVVMHPSES